jgi:hypothetical protein
MQPGSYKRCKRQYTGIRPQEHNKPIDSWKLQPHLPQLLRAAGLCCALCCRISLLL